MSDVEPGAVPNSEFSLMDLINDLGSDVSEERRSRASEKLAKLLLFMVRKRMSARFRSEQESGDLAQDVFKSVLNRLKREAPQFKRDAGVMSYLRTAVNNRIIGCDRRLRMKPPTDEDPVLENVGQNMSPSVPARQREIEARLKRILDSENFRLFQLRTHDELSWDEIGGILRIEPKAAMMRFHRMKKMLRDHFGSEFE